MDVVAEVVEVVVTFVVVILAEAEVVVLGSSVCRAEHATGHGFASVEQKLNLMGHFYAVKSSLGYTRLKHF